MFILVNTLFHLKNYKKYKNLVLVFGIFLTAIISYQVLLYPSVFEYILKKTFVRYTNTVLEIKVRRASPLFGFDFSGINLYTGNTRIPLFKAKRLKISFFLPSILVGHIGIRQLELDSPMVYLINKNGKWNYEALFGPSSGKIEEETTAESSPVTSIKTFLPIKIYANIVLRKAGFIYKNRQNDAKNETILKLQNLNFRLSIISKTFTEIPLDAGAFNIFETFIMGLNPAEPLEITFKEKNEINGTFRFTWLIFRDKRNGRSDFISRLKIDSSSLIAHRRGRLALPVGFSMGYNAVYDSSKDRLLIRNLDLKHLGRPWFVLSANVNNISKDNRTLQFRILRSQINLTPFYRLLSLLSGGKTNYFGGKLELDSFTFSGPLHDLQFEGEIRGENLYYKQARLDLHRLKKFRMKIKSSVDLYQVLPFIKKPVGYKEKQKLVYKIFHFIKIPYLKAIYNGGKFIVRAHIKPVSGITADVYINNYKFDTYYTGRFADGIVDGRVLYKTNTDFTRMSFSGKLDVTDSRYVFKRSRSTRTNFYFDFNGKLIKQRGVTEIKFSRCNIRMADHDGNTTVTMNGSLDMSFGKRQFYHLKYRKISVDYNKLHPSLPGSIQHAMKPYRNFLRNGFNLETNTRVTLLNGTTDIKTSSIIKLPNYKNHTARMHANMFFSNREMIIRRFDLNGLGGNLAISSKGKLYRKNSTSPWKTDFEFSFRLKSSELLELYRGYHMNGSIDMKMVFTPKWARGDLSFKDVNFEYRGENCADIHDPLCYRLRVERLNLELPVLHDMAIRKPLKLTEGVYYSASFNEEENEKPNLTLNSIAASHNPRNEYLPYTYFYTGANDKQIPYGLTARLVYKKNVLHINKLRINNYQRVTNKGGEVKWRPGGSINGKKIFFNFSDLSPENMEYSFFLQIMDLDLEPFLPRSRSGYDGIISADVQVTGHKIIDPFYNTTARIAVYRLSPEFSGFVSRVVMPGRVAEGIVNTSLTIPAIRVNLKGGLVYSTIVIKRELGLMNLILRLSGEEIKQERVPLAQFLAKAKSEVRE